MEEHGADLTGLAITAAAAGLALRRLSQPAVVDYILAGIATTAAPAHAAGISRRVDD